MVDILLLIVITISIIANILIFILYKKQREISEYFKRSLQEKKLRHDTVITEKITLGKQQLEAVFDAITDMICAIDKDFNIVRANKSYASYSKLSVQALPGKKCFEVFFKRKTPCSDCPAKISFTSQKPIFKHQKKIKINDKTEYFLITTYPVNDSLGKTINVIEHIRHNTEEKMILEQLIRSEKLATIGTMTAGIAHELLNPLSGISGTAGNMIQMPEKYGLNDKGIARITSIIESANRAGSIVKDLLHLSRKEEGTSIITNANEIVIKAIDAVRMKDIPPIEFKMSLEDNLPKIICDPGKIQQVFINLLTNAIQSIEAKKQIYEQANKSYSGVILIATHQSKGNVQIDISDNGIGIDDSIKDKIFEPFFTTRSPGEGVGLGLSICQKIIEEHEGKIFFESKETFTTFSVVLPSYSKKEVREVLG